MPNVDEALTAAAGRAFRLTRFYANLYRTEPTNASEVPYLSASDFHQADGLLDCVADREAIIGILPPYERDAGRLPFAVPEDEAELVLRQRRIVRTMGDLGVRIAVPSVLIVADGRGGPFASEVAKGFYWEGFQTSIVFGGGSADELRGRSTRLTPTTSCWPAADTFAMLLDRPPRTVWLVEDCGRPPIECARASLAPLRRRRGPHRFESGGPSRVRPRPRAIAHRGYPHSLLSHVTKLQFTCLPLVRFGLGRRVSTLEAPGMGAR